MNILKNIFGKRMSEDDYISDLQAKIKDLEKERQELKFQLNENELEYKDSLIHLENKVEKLTEENLKLQEDNAIYSIKLEQIESICKKNSKKNQQEDEDY